MLSGVPSYTGTRLNPLSTISRETSSGGVDTSRAKIFGRGTITLRTGVSENSKTLWISSISVWSRTPCCRPSFTRGLISSSETNVRAPAPLIRKRRSTARTFVSEEEIKHLVKEGRQREGKGDQQGHRLRVAQGQALGHELAQDEL